MFLSEVKENSEIILKIPLSNLSAAGGWMAN